MAKPTDRDRERAYAWAEKWFGEDPFDQAELDSADINDLVRVIADAREEGRLEAIEECAKIADGGAALLDGCIEIKFVTPEKLATDLAKDIADGIRSLGKEST